MFKRKNVKAEKKEIVSAAEIKINDTNNSTNEESAQDNNEVVLEKKLKKAQSERNEFGHLLSSSAARIDNCIVLRITDRKEIANKARTTTGRVSTHLLHLREKFGKDEVIMKKLGLTKIEEKPSEPKTEEKKTELSK